MRILVTGGVRSGKSVHAEQLFADRSQVTYLATGPRPDPSDQEWSARVKAHQDRRPSSWTTVESTDLSQVLSGPRSTPVLVDCLGNWVTSQLDLLDAWNGPAWRDSFDESLTRTVAAIGATDDLVLVTNEVGMGVVPAHASGRLFRDLLGQVNQRVAAACDEVHLVIAGRVLVL